MDALTRRACGPVARRLALALAALALAADASRAPAAAYRTANFTVDAATPQLAKEIGDAAENCRRVLALEWIGKELPRWSQPCPIQARVAPHLGAGGETSFIFDGGEVFGWRMQVQGSRERVLDSVIPHEVTHTIFASHFRRPLPRWADEGACTTVEHESEINKQEQLLIEFLTSRRGIPFSNMFAMREYPRDVLPLYAQGHSLARYLIAQRGKRAFMQFLADGMSDEHWPRAIQKHYQYQNLLALQEDWLGWVRVGCPPVKPQGDVLLASAESDATATTVPAQPQAMEATASAVAEEPIVRGQDPAARVAAGASPRPSRGAYAHDPWLSGTAPYEPAPEPPVTPTPEQLFGSTGPGVEWPAERPAPTSPQNASVYEAIRQSDVMRR
ncbi:MAG: hypothetical protein KF688_03690 [Pirellulales bacterium]|nr:hypothetical protein [Pirellulales bacterium]